MMKLILSGPENTFGIMSKSLNRFWFSYMILHYNALHYKAAFITLTWHSSLESIQSELIWLIILGLRLVIK